MRCEHCPVPVGRPCSATRCALAAQGGPWPAHVAGVEAITKGVVPPPPSPPPLPPLRARALTFARALVRHARNRFRRADRALATLRRAHCRGCSQLRADGRCGACGCHAGAKSAWLSETCPLGLWPAPVDPSSFPTPTPGAETMPASNLIDWLAEFFKPKPKPKPPEPAGPPAAGGSADSWAYPGTARHVRFLSRRPDATNRDADA